MANLFEQKLKDFEMRALTLQDFQDACIVAQLDRMRARMKAHRQNLVGCAFHIDNFIRHLALGREELRRRAVSRFQLKLTTSFCADLWTSLQQWVERRSQDEPMICCETFLKMADAIQTFQAYEMDFLANIFERVDRLRKGEVAGG
ncbi:unnamed protein product [Effrenium voratum]|uniref:Uncharacterized protein n=1 Tax=Effrenium voratum TaxID=2562239 RepID=A0AA36J973_9DINO|nr:unnamed protein product [Effrenium voratum]